MIQRLDALDSPQIHQIWQVLAQIPDPEIPVLNIVELGMIRQVSARDNGWQIQFTPTYSGCPATEMLQESIQETLAQAGFAPVTIEVVLSPAWTTDWMSLETRQRLNAFGIAPPNGHYCDHAEGSGQPAYCPHCGSEQVSLVSEFSSTACKSHYRCDQCLEPFDYFKCI